MMHKQVQRFQIVVTACAILAMQPVKCCERFATVADYWSAIYPLASETCLENPPLKSGTPWFLYADVMPEELIVQYNASAITNPATWVTKDYSPPAMNEPYRPTYSSNESFQINQYPPDAWWDFERYVGVPSYTAVEVTHELTSRGERQGSANKSAPHYPGQGWWVYYSPGSGVWMNVGNTLAAPNKLAALNRLGMNFTEIANLFWNSTTYFPLGGECETFPAYPAEQVYDITKHLTGASKTWLTLEMMLELAAYGNLPLAKKYGVTPEDLYQLNRLNNLYGADTQLITRAKAQGFDSIQFTTQANPCRGWAYEIVFIGGNATQPTWGEFYDWVSQWLSIADPCLTDTGLGGLNAFNNLDTNGPCTFPTDRYTCLFCEETIISQVCMPNMVGALRHKRKLMEVRRSARDVVMG